MGLHQVLKKRQEMLKSIKVSTSTGKGAFKRKIWKTFFGERLTNQ